MQKNSFNKESYFKYLELKKCDDQAKDVIRRCCSDPDIVRFSEFRSYYDTHYHCDLLIKYRDKYLIADAKTISDKYLVYEPGISYNYSFQIEKNGGKKYDEISNHPDVILFVSRGFKTEVYGYMFESLPKIIKKGSIFTSNDGKNKYVLIGNDIVESEYDFILRKNGVIINYFNSRDTGEDIEKKLYDLACSEENEMKTKGIEDIFNNVLKFK